VAFSRRLVLAEERAIALHEYAQVQIDEQLKILNSINRTIDEMLTTMSYHHTLTNLHYQLIELENCIRDEESAIAQMKSGFLATSLIPKDKLKQIIIKAHDRIKQHYPVLTPVFGEATEPYYDKNTVTCVSSKDQIIALLKIPVIGLKFFHQSRRPLRDT